MDMIRLSLTDLEKLVSDDWRNDIYVHWNGGGTFGYEVWKRRDSSFVKNILKRGLYVNPKYLQQQLELFA